MMMIDLAWFCICGVSLYLTEIYIYIYNINFRERRLIQIVRSGIIHHHQCISGPGGWKNQWKEHDELESNNMETIQPEPKTPSLPPLENINRCMRHSFPPFILPLKILFHTYKHARISNTTQYHTHSTPYRTARHVTSRTHSPKKGHHSTRLYKKKNS